MKISVLLASAVYVFVMSAAAPLLGQVNTGELRLNVTDDAGQLRKAFVILSNEAADYHGFFITDPSGVVDCRTIPFGLYIVMVTEPGFSTASINVDVRSALPVYRDVHLSLAPLTTTVQVNSSDTLIGPNVPSSVMQIGSQQIQNRLVSLPGRSVQELVDSQPGWLYEGNAVLHPRGSEYQTQFVVDGIPLTDNRSPSFGPEIGADDLSSLSIYTAGFPAEYGRKLGGVVELNTQRDMQAGLHGQFVLSGGSYATGSSFGELQYHQGKNMLAISASGDMTDHYLNPVVPENYTNAGTAGDFSGHYDRDLSSPDRLTLSVRHEFSRFSIPNELLQEQAGQRQYGSNVETMGIANFQYIFSPNGMVTFAAMGRNNSNNLYSNAESTPIAAFQNNYFNEGYFKSNFSYHRGRQEFKAGVESDNTFLHEDFSYDITDPSQYDPDTPASLNFIASRPDLEQSAFVEDLVHFRNWTASVGIRYDHYQLLLNEYGFSPRLSIGRFFSSANLMLHASFDRIFQTPSFENILISSSPQVESLSDQFLRLPVKPSRGNYWEGGLAKALSEWGRLDLNVYRRNLRNYADDNQLLNTGISYPISFDRGVVFGAEGKCEIVHLGKLNGFGSYSYMVGNAWLPVTGGLFLGEDAQTATAQLFGHFPDSQDQRNTVRTRFQYQATQRFWIASGLTFGSGLPFAYTGTEAEALAQYGPQVVERLNFARGRVRPSLSFNVTASAELFKSDNLSVRLQADGENLNNRLNLIDFGGLFSGNAIGPARMFLLRLSTRF